MPVTEKSVYAKGCMPGANSDKTVNHTINSEVDGAKISGLTHLCNDVDFCNGAPPLSSVMAVTIVFSLVLSFLFAI